VKGLLAHDYAKQRAALIQDAAACKVSAGEPDMSDTTYLSAVDKQGNIASLIQSNYSGFGSGVTALGMGFALQNRGGLFTLERDHPNVLAPRKRPFHTIIPGFMSKGDLHIGFGIMGGANQPVAHAQFVSNVVDYGMNIQAALEAPRFTVSRDLGCEVPIESRVKAEVLEQLRQKGHQFDVRKEYSTIMGRGQAVLHDGKTGVNYGASDPRADGSAEPEPLP
jgi:gamma-glutamyltranspeptidase/glutathione hydrolase